MSEQSQRLTRFINSIIRVKSIDLAEETGMARSTIARYLGGTLEPSSKFLRYMRNKYKLSYDWYFEGTGKPQIDTKEKLTMTVLSELTATLELVLKRQSMMERTLNKVVADFYAQAPAAKHN